jgi:hypothetical protein
MGTLAYLLDLSKVKSKYGNPKNQLQYKHDNQ